MLRTIAHVDFDAFYTQVEINRRPHLIGKPVAVCQYNTFQGGSIIALSYEAKRLGVKRSMKGEVAQKVCPEIELITVPVKNDKADLTIYREEGMKVFQLLQESGAVVEKTSIDEAYLDITKLTSDMMNGWEERTDKDVYIELISDSHVIGVNGVKEWVLEMLHTKSSIVFGAMVCADLRKKVLDAFGYTLSAGITYNKMLAKCISGINKPSAQTILSEPFIDSFLETLPLRNLNGFGGKLGDILIEECNIAVLGELRMKSKEELVKLTRGQRVDWICDAVRGIDNDPVESRLLPKSVGCSKNFRGPMLLKTVEQVEKALSKLAQEISDRCNSLKDENLVIPTKISASFCVKTDLVKRKGLKFNIAGKALSKSGTFPQSVTPDSIDKCVCQLMHSIGISHIGKEFTITALCINTYNFVTIAKSKSDIQSAFSKSNNTKRKEPLTWENVDKKMLYQLPEDLRNEIVHTMEPRKKIQKSSILDMLRNKNTSDKPSNSKISFPNSIHEVDIDVLSALPEAEQKLIIESFHPASKKAKTLKEIWQ